MKLSKDEIIKKLAEVVITTAPIDKEGKEGFDYYECSLCKGWSYFNPIPHKDHKEDCPVLLAEEVLRDCQKCIHVGFDNECNCVNKNKYKVKCEACNGEGIFYIEGVAVLGECEECNGTGVKK